MMPEFFLIDAATGKPAAAYRTTIRFKDDEEVQVKDMDQQEAKDWLATLTDCKFVIAGSNAQCLRLQTTSMGCEAEIWGIGEIHFPSRIWSSIADAEDEPR